MPVRRAPYLSKIRRPALQFALVQANDKAQDAPARSTGARIRARGSVRYAHSMEM